MNGLMRSKFSSRCNACGRRVNVGDFIEKGSWVHQACAEKGLYEPTPVPDKFIPDSDCYIKPTEESFSIRDFYIENRGHLVVEAKAGSGKTTLLEWLLTTTVDRHRSPGFLPKPKWRRQMEVLSVCFNRNIQAELNERVGEIPGVVTKTLNSFGFSAIMRYYRDIKRFTVNDGKTKKISEELYPWRRAEIDPTQLLYNSDMVTALTEFIPLVKATLAHPGEYSYLLDKYRVRLGLVERRDFYKAVDRVMFESLRLIEAEGYLDYDDQIWLPTIREGMNFWEDCPYWPDYVKYLPEIRIQHYNVVLVDEAQDLNRAQAILAFMAAGLRTFGTSLSTSGRMIVVGDSKQSIYQWRAADSKSMHNIYKMLSQTERGCEIKGLSYCWRCPRLVVELAQKILDLPPEETIKCADHAPDGEINYIMERELQDHLREEDVHKSPGGHIRAMILSRRNAPLVKLAFKLLSQKIPVTIRGRDVCRDIIRFIDNHRDMSNDSTISLLINLSEFLERERLFIIEMYGYKEVEARLQIYVDKVETIKALMEFPEVKKSRSIEIMKQALNNLFKSSFCYICNAEAETDKSYCDNCFVKTGEKIKIPEVEGILLSSVHRAKGLEALKVFLIDLACITGEPPWVKDLPPESEVREEEKHIYYVAVTRTKFAKDSEGESGKLYYVSERKAPRKEKSQIQVTEVKAVLEEETKSLLVGIDDIPVELPVAWDGEIEPTLDDWKILRNIYIEAGLPSKLAIVPGWKQYALLVNGVVAVNTGFEICGDNQICKKRTFRVLTIKADGSKNKGKTIRKNGEWRKRILERINVILKECAASGDHWVGYNQTIEVENEEENKS